MAKKIRRLKKNDVYKKRNKKFKVERKTENDGCTIIVSSEINGEEVQNG